jgi:hypothetical protein
VLARSTIAGDGLSTLTTLGSDRECLFVFADVVVVAVVVAVVVVVVCGSSRGFAKGLQSDMALLRTERP